MPIPSLTLFLCSLSENQSLFAMPPWTNIWLLSAITLSMTLHMAVLYVDILSVCNGAFWPPASHSPLPPQVVFSLCPLSLNEWWAVLKISVPVILLDEVLKYIARTFIDGKQTAAKAVSSSSHHLHSSSAIKELLLLIFAWITYFILLIATSKELIGNPSYLPSWLSPL